MELGINQKGVENHISLIEEEKREAQRLLDEMKELSVSGNQIMMQRNVDDMNRLKQNIEGRIDFLNNMLQSYRSLKETVGERIREVSYNEIWRNEE